MERLAAGDGEAFSELYRRHRRRVFRQAMEITRAPGMAEEVTQDAFLSLWRGAARFDASRASLSTWLSAVVRNRSIDARRRSARHATTVALEDAPVAELPSPERFEEELAARLSGQALRRLAARLPHEQRQVVFLGFYAGLSQPEIARLIDRPVGTVKGRQRLALEKLARGLRAAPA